MGRRDVRRGTRSLLWIWASLLGCSSASSNVESQEQGLSIGTPTYMVGGSSPVATSACVEEGEAVPSRSPGTGPLFFEANASFFASSASTTWSNWNKNGTTEYSIPTSPSGIATEGDAWTSYSSNFSLLYVGGIAFDSTNMSCLGLAATSPSSVPGSWTYPMQCVVDKRTDQPMIRFDDVADDLWAMSRQGGSGLRLDAWSCATSPAFPGAGCGSTTYSGTAIGVDTLRFGIDVNPCTNHLIAAFVDSSNNLKMRFYNDTGVQQGVTYTLRALNAPTPNTGCGNGIVRRCGLGTGTDCDGTTNPVSSDCLRSNQRPTVVTKLISSSPLKCYAAVAVDTSLLASGTDYYTKSQLFIVDVSNESSPSTVKNWQSTSGSSTWNQYDSYVIGEAGNQDLGWFWLSDLGDACHVLEEGQVDSSFAVTSLSSTGRINGSGLTFPAMRFSGTAGMSDYMYGVRDGASDGALYPGWSESVVTSCSSGLSCTVDGTSHHYSLAAKMNRVVP